VLLSASAAPTIVVSRSNLVGSFRPASSCAILSIDCTRRPTLARLVLAEGILISKGALQGQVIVSRGHASADVACE